MYTHTRVADACGTRSNCYWLCTSNTARSLASVIASAKSLFEPVFEMPPLSRITGAENFFGTGLHNRRYACKVGAQVRSAALFCTHRYIPTALQLRLPVPATMCCNSV
jgi:hypothetical protein